MAFTGVQMGFAQAVNVGFVSNLPFLLLSEITENTCYKDKIQNTKIVITFQEKCLRLNPWRLQNTTALG